VKLAGAVPPRKTPTRTVNLPYAFDEFSVNAEVLVIEMGENFDSIFGTPWLIRHRLATDWLARLVKVWNRRIDVDEVSCVGQSTRKLWLDVAVVDRTTLRVADWVSGGSACSICQRSVESVL